MFHLYNGLPVLRRFHLLPSVSRVCDVKKIHVIADSPVCNENQTGKIQSIIDVVWIKVSQDRISMPVSRT